MFRDYDYIQTFDDMIFIVRGDDHSIKSVHCTPVYIPNKNGDHIDKRTGQRYIKKVDEYPTHDSIVAKLHPEYFPALNDIKNTYVIPVSDIKKIFHPREKTREILEDNNVDLVWKNVIKNLSLISEISLEDIGIYGSRLLNLENKDSDVDIVIYGFDNFRKLKLHFDDVLSASEIRKPSLQQRIKRIASWDKYSVINQEKLLQMELRRWSRINVYRDEITSIRFAYDDEEIPNRINLPPISREVNLRGTVLDSEKTNFCPHIAKVNIKGEEVFVISYGFLFFSCVRDFDKVEVLGNLRIGHDNTYITLDEAYHYITPV